MYLRNIIAKKETSQIFASKALCDLFQGDEQFQKNFHVFGRSPDPLTVQESLCYRHAINI